MGHYIGIPTSRVPVFNSGIFVVPTADAVATGKCNSYLFMVRIFSFRGLRRQSDRGTVAQRNDHWRARMAQSHEELNGFVCSHISFHVSNLAYNKSSVLQTFDHMTGGQPDSS